jgi:hypothetical protein
MAALGFIPLLAFLDGSEEALAGRLRPGNAGANTAPDKVADLDAARAQLPTRVAARESILVRVDSAGATHELADHCRDGRMRFSLGLDLTEPVREAIALPASGALPRKRPLRARDSHARTLAPAHAADNLTRADRPTVSGPMLDRG